MKTLPLKTLSAAALLAATACTTAPTDPAARAAWEAEKTARTEARRPAPGSVLPGSTREADPAAGKDFEDLQDQMQGPDPLGDH